VAIGSPNNVEVLLERFMMLCFREVGVGLSNHLDCGTDRSEPAAKSLLNAPTNTDDVRRRRILDNASHMNVPAGSKTLSQDA
jgi:hypothetical protein